jgi:hypothetical protein
VTRAQLEAYNCSGSANALASCILFHAPGQSWRS